MPKRAVRDPSPVRSACLHAGLGALVLGALTGVLGFTVNTFGDPSQAGPRETLALFDSEPVDAAPILKARLEAPDAQSRREVSAVLTAAAEPSLGVDYPGAMPAAAAAPAEQGAAAAPAGVRINGHTVLPGQSLSEVVSVDSLSVTPAAGLWERKGADRLPKISQDGRTPASEYARPFANPENRPMVSIVVGGLGMNRTHTQSAIDELPPEVTLSFVPYARGLQSWVNKARDAGHEVLIELPMEPHDYGRVRPHPHTLTVSATAEENTARLEWALSRATGFFGVTNYQGDKFAADRDALLPIAAVLADRGVAFVQDGDLRRSALRPVAAETGLSLVKAKHTIDDEMDAAAIEARLMALESAAKEKGAALGAGFAYPITIDLVASWAERLHGKGLILAPASALATTPQAATRVTSLSTPSASGDPAP